MANFIAAFALQQLQDMEQLQRDLGRGRPRRKRRGARTERVAGTVPQATARDPHPGQVQLPAQQ